MERLRLIRKDILIRPLDPNDIGKKLIKVYGRDKTQEQLRGENKVKLYTVLVTGPSCKEVKVGDTIMVNWVDTVPPVEFNGEMVTLTDESRVLGICEHLNT